MEGLAGSESLAGPSLAKRQAWQDRRLQVARHWPHSRRGGLQEVAAGDTGDQGAEGEVVGAGAHWQGG